MNENDIFITSIEVKKVRNIENFIIPLSETERKHLIITGKNGSGKTSLLLEINDCLELFISGCEFFEGAIKNYKKLQDDVFLKKEANIHVENFQRKTNFLGLDIKMSKLFNKALANMNEATLETTKLDKILLDKIKSLILITFKSKREMLSVIPSGVEKVELRKTYPPSERENTKFVQYIVNLKFDSLLAKVDNDIESSVKIDNWFENFEKQLKKLFEADNLQLIFDRKNYNFYIQIGNNEPFTLNQLSDGYSAVLSIITELILRMEATGNKAYDLQGVVLIDEIETHLHVALQKKIMPFLCAFFPKIQFIVTTHSPFVISSLENAVVCDLERKEVISEDLTGYSYNALVESYFDTDEYSQAIKEKLYRYKFLSEQETLSDDEEDEYDNLEDYFDNLPKFRAAALAAEAERIGLKKMMRKG